MRGALQVRWCGNARQTFGREKSDDETYVSVVYIWYPNYYFRMFHDECCLKYSVHVVAVIL